MAPKFAANSQKSLKNVEADGSSVILPSERFHRPRWQFCQNCRNVEADGGRWFIGDFTQWAISSASMVILGKNFVQVDESSNVEADDRLTESFKFSSTVVMVFGSFHCVCGSYQLECDSPPLRPLRDVYS